MTYRVAIIAGQLVIGGAERQLYLWLSHLDRERYQPVVVTLHPNCGDYWENAIASLNIPLLRVPRNRNRLNRTLEIIRVLKPYRPHLIHGWHLFASPYAGIAAKILGAKSLGSLRGSFQIFQNSFPEANLTFYLTDAILANSQSAAEQLLVAKKRKNQEIFSIQNAVEIPRMDRSTMRDELSHHFGTSSEHIWIGSLGRLDPDKHFEYLFKAMAFLQAHEKNIHLFLIGDGPERSKLEEAARSLGINNAVTFTGEVLNARAWLCALDIFCYPSLDEGLPNAVMEAAVAGIPIVAWRVPFIEELLEDEKMALLVDAKDIIKLRDGILKLIRNPELRSRLGEAAKNHVRQEFNLERYISRMSSVYEQLLGENNISIFD